MTWLPLFIAEANPPTGADRDGIVLTVRAWHIIVVLLAVILSVQLRRFVYYLLPQKQAESWTWTITAVIALGVVWWFFQQGSLDQVLKLPVDDNVLLSAEVMAALVTAIAAAIGAYFIADDMLEQAQERTARRTAAQLHYSEKVKLLQDFAHKGQKIMYYAMSYRPAEEWQLRHSARSSSEYAKSKEGPGAGFGPGRMDGKETLAHFYDRQQKFVEAGSMDGMARAVESNFFPSNDLQEVLVPPKYPTGDEPNLDLEQHRVGTEAFIELFDEFLNPQNFKEFKDYPSAARELRKLFRKINSQYDQLIKAMHDKLGDERRCLANSQDNTCSVDPASDAQEQPHEKSRSAVHLLSRLFGPLRPARLQRQRRGRVRPRSEPGGQ
ncbi:MAG: hypothetical protein AAGJ38_09635 [Planctomycetota bacterium]